MPTITLTLPASGNVITAGLHANNYTILQTLLNGGLDTANWASGKIFAPSKFLQEGATTGQGVVWNGSIWAPATVIPTYQTTLPGSPVDGQQTILVDSVSAPTWAWLLRFNSTSGKWDFLGGAPIYAEVTTSETTASTTYAALATAGPSIAIPVAGDYFVELGYDSSSETGTGFTKMSYDIGGTGAVDADATISYATSAAVPYVSAMRKRKKTGLTAVTLTSKYKTSSGTAGFEARWMSVTPIRVG